MHVLSWKTYHVALSLVDLLRLTIYILTFIVVLELNSIDQHPTIIGPPHSKKSTLIFTPKYGDYAMFLLKMYTFLEDNLRLAPKVSSPKSANLN